MEFADLLCRRRTVRHYRTDPVVSDIVQRIVRVVRRAPSAGFSQGHRVVVVTEPELRQRIADLGESWYLERGSEPWLSQAPVPDSRHPGGLLPRALPGTGQAGGPGR